jgi:hypothetical protein
VTLTVARLAWIIEQARAAVEGEFVASRDGRMPLELLQAIAFLAANHEAKSLALDDLQQRWIDEAQRVGGTMGTCLESVAHQLAACRIAALVALEPSA